MFVSRTKIDPVQNNETAFVTDPTIRWTLECEVVNLTASPTEAYFDILFGQDFARKCRHLLGKDLYDQPVMS